jgi:hypothetical protein
MLPPIPVQRYLVPEQMPSIPEGFTPVDDKLLGGLPHRIRLNAALTLVVVVPTGLAATWRDLDPITLVSSSETEFTPTTAEPDQEIGAAIRSPARIIVRRSGTTIASVPLCAGLQRTVPEGGRQETGMCIELLIRGWDIRAGSLRGLGDFGSYISLAWRRADQAVDFFSPPPVNPYLLPRLEQAARMESTLGGKP